MTHNEQTAELLSEIDVDELATALSPYGSGKGLRKSKPDADGLTQYVWRMATFAAGHDTSMPVTATWDLQDALDERNIDVRVIGTLDDDAKELLRALEGVVDDVCAALGENPNRGAERWGRTGLFGRAR